MGKIVVFQWIFLFLPIYLITRLNAQTDDNEVIIFPIDLLPRILATSANIQPLVDEMMQNYPKFLHCRMMIFPMIVNGQATVFTVMNPIGLIVPEYALRGLSFMLLLHPGPDATCPNMTNVSRRLRLFLNRIKQCDVSLLSENRFNSRNLKIYKPTGESSVSFVYHNNFFLCCSLIFS